MRWLSIVYVSTMHNVEYWARWRRLTRKPIFGRSEEGWSAREVAWHFHWSIYPTQRKPIASSFVPLNNIHYGKTRRSPGPFRFVSTRDTFFHFAEILSGESSFSSKCKLCFCEYLSRYRLKWTTRRAIHGWIISYLKVLTEDRAFKIIWYN